MENIKVKLEVLDPTSTITESHELNFKQTHVGGRMILTIGENQFVVSDNGRSINRMFTTID